MAQENPWEVPADEGATGQVFTIRTVEDFFKVPEHRRYICLREFHSWLFMHEATVDLLAAAAQSLHGDEGERLIRAAIRSERDVFRWVDDGKATVSVTMNAAEGDPTHD